MKKKCLFIISMLLIFTLVVFTTSCSKIAEIIGEILDNPGDYNISMNLSKSGTTLVGTLTMLKKSDGTSFYPNQGNIQSATIGNSTTPTCTITVTITQGSSSTAGTAGDYVEVIDGSGSMTSSDPTKNRLIAAKNFCTAVLSGSTAVSGTKVGVNHFSGGFSELTMDVPLTSDATTLGVTIDLGGASGGTPLWAAVETGITEVIKGSNGVKSIIALTDGKAGDTYATAVALATANNVVIHTVALTGSTWDKTELEEAAQLTNGSYTELTGANLNTFYTNLAIATSTAGSVVIDISNCNLTSPGTYTIHLVMVFVDSNGSSQTEEKDFVVTI